MSNRKQAFAQPLSNPTTKYLEWKSNDKSFSYWDKATEKEVSLNLPFKFLLLDELHTVGGWNDASGSKIFANEVKFIGKQEMTVKSFKGGVIAKGTYTDIKDKVKNAGGHYLKSIYIMTEDGSLCQIKLKGSAVQGWGDFTQANRDKLSSCWTEINSAIDGKKGAVTFSTPDFSVGSALNQEQEGLADNVFDSLESYLKAYLVKKEETEEKVLTDDSADVGDENF